LPLSELVPMSYIEAVKHFFNFNPAWLLFSSMEYGDFSESSKYKMEMLRPVNQPNQFYLTMLDIKNERLDFDLSYQSRKYKPETVKMFLDSYKIIINHAADNPELSINEILVKYKKEMMK
jgi:hypothetical protein